MPRLTGSFLAIWFAIALIGGLADGTFLVGFTSGGPQTDDAKIVEDIGQFDVATTSSSGLFGAVSDVVGGVVGFAVGIVKMIVAWANALTFNFSLFEGTYQPYRWGLMILLGAPMSLELAFRVFGR